MKPTMSMSSDPTATAAAAAAYTDPNSYYFDNTNTNSQFVPRDSAIQALNTIIQLHFEKTLEKKRSIDHQKKQLHKHFLLFFLFLALNLSALLQPRLQCRHCWVPIAMLSLSFLIFYVAVAQTLRCINEFKYQRRCHKLTLALATDRLRELKRGGDERAAVMLPADFEIHYQEPPESYLVKFKRSWAMHFGFLIATFGVMVSASVVILCF